jgi:hypothetical protein
MEAAPAGAEACAPRLFITDDGEEIIPHAALFVTMLQGKGVPPLVSVSDLKHIAGNAPKWLQEFKVHLQCSIQLCAC